ncbi:MAG: response regulator transcription factor [Rhodococcus sp. (in: high G+C Gram-positive bacteria)]
MTDFRIAVVDDHPVFRLGLAALLSTLSGMTVLVQASSATEALASIDDNIDVVLMDLELGDGSGIEVTRSLSKRHPALRILVLTMHEDHEWLVASIRAGARGYLVKGAEPDEVERAIRAVASGGMIVGASVAATAMSAFAPTPNGPATELFPQLTQREREVLALVADGLDNAAISRRLFLSPKTVRNNVSNILGKLGLPSRAAAVAAAQELRNRSI